METPHPTPVLLDPGTDRALGFSWELRSRFDLPESVFVELLNREGLRHLRLERYSLPSEREASVDGLGDIVITRRTERGVWSVVRLAEGAVALVEISRGSATVEVAAADRSMVDGRCRDLADQLGACEEAEDEVPVTFWALGSHGPKSARRRIKAPSWSEMTANYEQSTGLDVAKLITSRVPSGGRLILWHGEPGTGKTNALRALARVWSDWCSTHFVTDPEAFLGSGTSYLLDVLTSDSSSMDPQTPSWKMVVLEDAGELLTADAHERTGQALSRLLNVTDGLLGQGMQVIVLVTTNEPLRKLHPAIQRPGRCWKEIEFLPLSEHEANQWLAAHDSGTRVTQPVAIADLYAVLRGREPKLRPAFGFGAAS